MAKKVLITLFVISIWMFTSSAFSANVSTLLERGIYAEETKGDLDEAISIYQKIIDENTGNSANIAEAYYRLGTCYLKTGDETKAIEMFKELLTGFREHEEIAADARDQLLKLNALDEGEQINKPLELGQVPWEAGETCQYDVKTPTGAGSGKMFRSVKEVSKDGDDFWRIENYYATPIDGSHAYLRADVLKEDLRPVSGILKGSIVTMGYDFKAVYEKDHIQFTNTSKEKKDIPVVGIVYNIGQALEITRRLPLTENYSASYNAFDFPSGQITNVKLTVTGKETVTVPAGTFECYCLDVDSHSTINEKIWISTDVKKYIVKREKHDNTFELEKVTHVTTDEPVEFNDNELRISMSAPKGWHFVNSSITYDDANKKLLQIIAPEIKAAPFFLIVSHFGTYKRVHDVYNITKEILKKTFKNFTPRPESWVYSKIDGLPSLTYIADYDSKDKKMVEYRTYILDPQELATFVLRTDKETFEEIKTDVDSIVQSFKWNRK